jgi:hypothetical protein
VLGRRRERRGSTATTVLSTLGVTLGVTAIGVDVGVAMLARSQLQNAVDAGVLGGVAYLDATPAGVATAKSRARELVAANQALGGPVTVDAIEVGEIDATTGNRFQATSDPAAANAIRVRGARLGIPTPFGALYGRSQLGAATTAIAAQPPLEGAGKEDCYLPLAVPDCVLEHVAAYEAKGFQFASSNQDNTGWATLADGASEGDIANQIASPDFCGGLGTAQVGGSVHLSNGELASALSAMAAAIEASPATWSSEDQGYWGPLPAQMANSSIAAPRYGHVVQGPVLLFHDDSGGSCAAATPFDGSRRAITGLVWGVVYDVAAAGPKKNIRMKLDLTHQFAVGGGGGGIGNVAWQPPPVLFQ